MKAVVRKPVRNESASPTIELKNTHKPISRAGSARNSSDTESRLRADTVRLPASDKNWWLPR